MFDALRLRVAHTTSVPVTETGAVCSLNACALMPSNDLHQRNDHRLTMTTPVKPPSIKVVSVYGTRDSRRQKDAQIYSRLQSSPAVQSPAKVIPQPSPAKTPHIHGLKLAHTTVPSITRKLDFHLNLSNVIKYPRNSDRSKGLRHFSTKVCEKVREKGVTNYNEVADELVQEYFESMPSPPSSHEQQMYDQKNIRRRVYDALNVLMAMNIVSKEKKEIRWVGLPTSSLQECKRLEEEKSKRIARIKDKREDLYDLMVQLVTSCSVIERNEKAFAKKIRFGNATVPLPFVAICVDKRAVGNIAISADRTRYQFAFDRPFHLETETAILQALGLAHGLEKRNLKEADLETVKKYLPVAFAECLEEIFDEESTAKYEEDCTPPAVGTILSAVGTVASQQRNDMAKVKEEPVTLSHSYAKVGVVGPSGVGPRRDGQSSSVHRFINRRMVRQRDANGQP
uniref:E2F/DP family winged-helix DNA-binding domain-containing protein n=1 Tax=Trichuris muris TaxID=70415 RepID=A0A5S6QNR1_TRIMR